MALPEHGITRDDILGRLDSFKERDVRWRDGHAFTLAYNAGEDVVALAEEAYRRFATENALNTDAFPSLRRLQTEVCGIVGDWLQAGPDGAGERAPGSSPPVGRRAS